MVIIAIKSADAFIDLLARGISADRALSSLPQCELQFIAKVPIGVYLSARFFDWRFFPAPHHRRSAIDQLRIREATNNLDRLKFWAGSRPEWALATGALSGVFVLVVHGDDGRKSLIVVETIGIGSSRFALRLAQSGIFSMRGLRTKRGIRNPFTLGRVCPSSAKVTGCYFHHLANLVAFNTSS